MLIARRSLMLGALAALPAAYAMPAPPRSTPCRTRASVGYAQQLNDFEIASGKLALAKSANENIRGFATPHDRRSYQCRGRAGEGPPGIGVSYAPDGNAAPRTTVILQRLSQLEGGEFDVAYANAQLAVLTEAEQQFGANSTPPVRDLRSRPAWRASPSANFRASRAIARRPRHWPRACSLPA